MRTVRGPGPHPEQLPGMLLGSQGGASCPTPRPLMKPQVPLSQGGQKEAKRKALTGICHAQQTQYFSNESLSHSLQQLTYFFFPVLEPSTHLSFSEDDLFYFEKREAIRRNPNSTSHGPSLALHKDVPFSPNGSQPLPGSPTSKASSFRTGDYPLPPASSWVGAFPPESKQPSSKALPSPHSLSVTLPFPTSFHNQAS